MFLRFPLRALFPTARNFSLRFFSQDPLTKGHVPPMDPDTEKPVVNWDYQTELIAFRQRFDVPISGITVIQRALTHKSYIIENPDLINYEHNDRYALVGQTLMTHFVIEYLFLKYPKLPSFALRDAHNFVVGIPQLLKTAKHLGIQELYLTKEATEKLDTGLAEALLAIVGSVYQDQGPLLARQLVREFILYNLRGRDVYDMIKLEHPIEILTEILALKGRDKPTDELLWETGRESTRPMFCVLVHSGEDKLAEGVGQTIPRAKHDAYQTALLQLFYKDLRKFKIPSDLYGTTYKLDTDI